MRRDHYQLRNASFLFKTFCSLWLIAALTILAWNARMALSVLHWNRSALGHVMSIGNELYGLAWEHGVLFASLLLSQAVAYGALWIVLRMLYRRLALRRRVRTLIFMTMRGVCLATLATWITTPFFIMSQALAGPLALGSGLLLAGLGVFTLISLWIYPRWKNPKPTRVVIVGGGFAGLYTALGLDRALGYRRELDLVLVDQKNFFLFPPLLPSASVGTIETRQVTFPYRRILENTNIRYQKARVSGLDPKTRRILLEGGGELVYDKLVLAPGSTTQTFNTPGVREYALFVRELQDAVHIRSRLIDCFERAAVLAEQGDPALRQDAQDLVRFAIVGGGPTGIEIATEIQDLIHGILLKRYPEIDPAWPAVTIIQSGPQILPGWPAALVEATAKQLGHLGVQVILNNRVTAVHADAVLLKEGDPVKARTVLWCAGVQPSPLLRACGLTLDSSGRVPVNEYLQTSEWPEIFVLGDAASCPDVRTGKPLPPLGQVAFQQGDHMAKNLVHLLRGESLQPFRYFNFGALVSVGEHYAAVSLLGLHLRGFLGWVIWRTLYLVKIIGFSNRIRIVLDWTLDLLIERSISQLQEPVPSPTLEAPKVV